jgi:hypothetical protein
MTARNTVLWVLTGMALMAGPAIAQTPAAKPAARAPLAPRVPAPPPPLQAPTPTQAAAPTQGASDAGGNVKVERGAGGKKIYKITTEIRIEGKIQKPEAFYVLQKSSINYEWQELKQDFLPKILDSVSQAPF